MADPRPKTSPVKPQPAVREGDDGRLVPSRKDGDGTLVPSAPPVERREEPFGSRWSRLKREARERPVEKRSEVTDPQAPPPELPQPDTLTFDSDYRQFFHPKVGEDVRRAALKKLFSDPRFNVMDGLDVYIDDYSKTEPIPAAMLAGLKQAQNILQWAREDAEERRKAEEKAVRQADAEPAALEPPAPPSEIGLDEPVPPNSVPVEAGSADLSFRRTPESRER